MKKGEEIAMCQPKKDAKRKRLLYLGLILAVLLLIPIYLIVTRWSKTIVGMDILYIFLCSLTVMILYFFPQLLFLQNIQIDGTNVSVKRSGFLPDRLVFPKSDVVYCRLDRKDGTPLTQQWADPEPKAGFAIAFVLKNGMKVTSDKINFDLEDFKNFRMVLPNLITSEETKNYTTSSKKEVHIHHTRYFIIPALGILLLFIAYIFYKVAFTIV